MGGVQHRRNILINPCGGNRVAAHNNYHSVGIGFVDCLDQTFLLFREHNIRPVDFFLAVQQRMVADEYDSDLCGFGRLNCSFYTVYNNLFVEGVRFGTGILFTNMQGAILFAN
ncbi:hypothetical protein D3C73_1147080 [compost metagenome]